MKALLLLLVFLATPFTSEAQFAANSEINPGPSITLSSSYPAPGEQVTARLDDYRSVAQGSAINWYLNDTLISEAENRREVLVTAPSVGTRATLKALVTLSSGLRETYTAVIEPVYLDIIIEPQTHVPSFYKGRALPSMGSTVTFTALMNNGKPMGTQFVYTWRINDTVFEGGPLRARNKISATMPTGTSILLSLNVSTYGGVTVAEKNMYVPLVRPEIVFYEVSPLYGISTKAIDRALNLIGDSATVQAEPYYLDSNVFNNPNVLEWEIDGKRVSPPASNPYEIVLEKTGFPGQARLNFHVRSLSQLLQGAEREIEINI